MRSKYVFNKNNKNTRPDLTHKHTLFHLYSTLPPYHNLSYPQKKKKKKKKKKKRHINKKIASLTLSLSIWTHRFLVSFTLFLCVNRTHLSKKYKFINPTLSCKPLSISISLLITILPLFNLTNCPSSFTSISFTSSLQVNNTEGHRRMTSFYVSIWTRPLMTTSSAPR